MSSYLLRPQIKKAGVGLIAVLAVFVGIGPGGLPNGTNPLTADAAPAARMVTNNGTSPLIYFVLDTEREASEKVRDIKAINELINWTRVESPGTLYFFHLTNIHLGHADPELLLYDGSEQHDRRKVNALDAYGSQSLPPKIREPHRLDQELRILTTHLRYLQTAGILPRGGGRPRWLLAFYDFDWIDTTRHLSSVGRHLGDGWLVAPRSPLLAGFLSQDNTLWSGAKVLVFLSHGGDLNVRRGKERFLGRLMRLVDADLFYAGPTYAASVGASPLANDYVRALGDGRLTAIAAGTPGRVELLQMTGPDRRTETVDAY